MPNVHDDDEESLWFADESDWITRDTAGVITHGPCLPCGCPLDADCDGRHS